MSVFQQTLSLRTRSRRDEGDTSDYSYGKHRIVTIRDKRDRSGRPVPHVGRESGPPAPDHEEKLSQKIAEVHYLLEIEQ